MHVWERRDMCWFEWQRNWLTPFSLCFICREGCMRNDIFCVVEDFVWVLWVITFLLPTSEKKDLWWFVIRNKYHIYTFFLLLYNADWIRCAALLRMTTFQQLHNKVELPAASFHAGNDSVSFAMQAKTQRIFTPVGSEIYSFCQFSLRYRFGNKNHSSLKRGITACLRERSTFLKRDSKLEYCFSIWKCPTTSKTPFMNSFTRRTFVISALLLFYMTHL